MITLLVLIVMVVLAPVIVLGLTAHPISLDPLLSIIIVLLVWAAIAGLMIGFGF